MTQPENDQVPPFMDFGSVPATEMPPFAAPAEVRSTSDLPARFFLGDLDAGSFKRSGRGWQAMYRDADPEVFCEVHYDVRSKSLRIIQHYHGRRLDFRGAGAEFNNALESYAVFPKEWEEELQSRVSEIGNLRFPKLPPQVPAPVGFPDGVFKTIFLPLPISKVPVAREFLARVSADRRIRTGVGVSAVLGCSFVNFLVGRVQPAQLGVRSLFDRVWAETGLPPGDAPELQTAPDGSQALRFCGNTTRCESNASCGTCCV
jgi:hypothetical protein